MIDYSFSYQDLEFFLLIFIRMSLFFTTAPFFSTQNVPQTVKAGMAFFISVLVYTTLSPHPQIEYSSVIGFAIIVLKEAIAGAMMGFGANICLSITNFAGKLADMEMGLSMVQLFDPLTRENSGFMGSIYQYSVTLILLITNLHHYILRAFIESYTLIPIGGVRFSSENIITAVMTFLVDYLSIAFRFCLPVVAAIMVLNALLGILAKTSPQMNMFSVGIQLKIFFGFAVVITTVGVLPSVSEFIYREMDKMLQLMIQGLR